MEVQLGLTHAGGRGGGGSYQVIDGRRADGGDHRGFAVATEASGTAPNQSGVRATCTLLAPAQAIPVLEDAGELGVTVWGVGGGAGGEGKHDLEDDSGA